jgi:RNA methyltransferase, TrmH family
LDTISIGKHNPLLADIRKAIQRGALTSGGLLPIEGPRLVQEAYASGITIETLLLREGCSLVDLPPASVRYTLELGAFKGVQDTEHSQGVIALVRPRVWTLDQVLLGLQAPVAVLGGLQDPGNVGTILRVVESFNGGGCLGLSGTVSVHNPKVVRASAGSVFRLPHAWNLSFENMVDDLKAKRIPLVGTSPYAADPLISWDWSRPAAILIGNEGSGLSSSQVSACSAMLQIPHAPQTESLNSAIAAAVVFYEAARGRSLP